MINEAVIRLLWNFYTHHTRGYAYGAITEIF